MGVLTVRESEEGATHVRSWCLHPIIGRVKLSTMIFSSTITGPDTYHISLTDKGSRFQQVTYELGEQAGVAVSQWLSPLGKRVPETRCSWYVHKDRWTLLFKAAWLGAEAWEHLWLMLAYFEWRIRRGP